MKKMYILINYPKSIVKKIHNWDISYTFIKLNKYLNIYFTYRNKLSLEIWCIKYQSKSHDSLTRCHFTENLGIN